MCNGQIHMNDVLVCKCQMACSPQKSLALPVSGVSTHPLALGK